MQHNYKRLKLAGLLALMHTGTAQANIELLQTPSVSSKLITSSVVTAIAPAPEGVIAIGERGHIFTWQDEQSWQQQRAPVSVLLTDIETLPNKTSIAIGHDAAILRSTDGSTWQKVFDGYDLATLKVALLEKQQTQLNKQLETLEDEDEIEELEFQLDEVIFSLEDAQTEQQVGPNKPLLSLTQVDDQTLFAVGAYGTLLRSNDAGVSWQLIDDLLENPDKFHLNAITYNQGVITIVGENGVSFSSADQGETWQFIELPYLGSMFGVIGNQTSSNLVAFGLQGNVLLSKDLGQSWQNVEMGNNISLLGGTMSQTGDVYLVGHGGVVSRFNVKSPDQVTVKKHPSGSAFSDVRVMDEQLILAGQFGLTAWQFK